MSLNQKNNTRSSLMKNITKQNEESFGAQRGGCATISRDFIYERILKK